MKRKKDCAISLVVLCTALCGSVAAAPFSVLLPPEPKPWEKTAADELKTWLSQAVGEGTISVGADAARGDARPPVFHVGDTELAKAKGLFSSGMLDEQWAIRSFGSDVVLNGGGSHGAIYAVSHFLEDFVGVRFWNDDDTDVPERQVLALPALNATGRPVFRYRDIYRCGDPKKATPRFAIMRRCGSGGA